MSLEQRCLALVNTEDVAALHERILRELVELSRAQGAALWAAADEQGALQLRAWRGLVEPTTLPDTVDAALVHTAPWLADKVLFVPISLPSGGLLGLVQLSDSLDGAFGGELLHPAQVLAQFAGAALRGAVRHAQLSRQGLRDGESGAYSLSYFTDYATKEIDKARRYSRGFSLLTFSLDNAQQLRLRFGRAFARDCLHLVLRRLGLLLRDSDVAARATDQECHALLPETDYLGGHLFMRRAMRALEDDPEVRERQRQVGFGLNAGVASFPGDGEDFDELLAACRRRMSERRDSLHGHLRLEPLGFWDSVDLLLGTSASPRLPETKGEPSRRGELPDALFGEVQAELARELLRSAGARALLFIGTAAIRRTLPLAQHLEAVGPEFLPRVFVLGRRADLQAHPGLTPVFLEGEERLARHDFLLWLGDGCAYALVQRKHRGATWGFHTSEATLVEALVAKLQTEYELQPF